MASIEQVKDQVERQDTPVEFVVLQLDSEPYRGLDGEPSKISVVGGESKKLRRWEETEREKLKALGFTASGTDIEERRRIDRAVAAVVAWRGWDKGGQELPCTPLNVRELLSHPEAEHILRQIELRVNGHGLFSKASSES